MACAASGNWRGAACLKGVYGSMTSMMADLHMHSTASDGQFEPEEVVRLAYAAGTQVMALTDHDSAQGVTRAAQEAGSLGMTLIPGIEMGCSCGMSREVHVLGYGMDPEHPIFIRHCEEKRRRREERAIAMVQRLAEAGKVIHMEEVRAMGDGVISRTHIARALVEAGYATSAPDAFAKYLKPGRCGYVPRPEFRVAEAIEIIGQTGGVAVLAHPMELGMSDGNLESLVHEWKEQGLKGIEAVHPSTGNQHLPFLLGLAAREGLIVTGGSDFHGERVNERRMRQGLERWRTAEHDVAALLEAIEAQRERVRTCRA